MPFDRRNVLKFAAFGWTVFKAPIQAAPEQIRQFASLFPNNARPVQNRNRRFLIETN